MKFLQQLLLNKEDVNDLKYQNSSVADIVALEVGSLGENIAVRRAASLRADDGGYLGYYVHSSCMGFVLSLGCLYLNLKF